MKAVERIHTQTARFDIRLAAACTQRNCKVAAEVLADEHAIPEQRSQARELIRLSELNLTTALQAYLKQL